MTASSITVIWGLREKKAWIALKLAPDGKNPSLQYSESLVLHAYVAKLRQDYGKWMHTVETVAVITAIKSKQSTEICSTVSSIKLLVLHIWSLCFLRLFNDFYCHFAQCVIWMSKSSFQIKVLLWHLHCQSPKQHKTCIQNRHSHYRDSTNEWIL